ncbi:MAG: GTP cyclohydrolase I [Myxococcota bacterium]
MTTQRRRELEAIFARLLEVAGRSNERETAETPQRAAQLWDEALLAGEGGSLKDVLNDPIPAESEDPVSMLDMGVHMVCPHHLTVSFGKAHVAFKPQRTIVGFGSLATLVERATSRLVLQEDATRDIARALHEQLDSKAAVAAIEATHPCHNIPHARSHGARAFTVASAGDPQEAKALEAMIFAAIQERT